MPSKHKSAPNNWDKEIHKSLPAVHNIYRQAPIKDKFFARIQYLSQRYSVLSKSALWLFVTIDFFLLSAIIHQCRAGSMNNDALCTCLAVSILVLSAEFLIYICLPLFIDCDKRLDLIQTTTDPLLLPYLLEIPFLPWKYMNEKINNTLKRLLNEIEAEHEGLLTSAQLNTLWKRAIGMHRNIKHFDPHFAITAIQAFKYVGDDRILERLHQLIQNTPGSLMQTHLMSAALECVPLLETRLAHNNTPKTLLRASDISDVCTETLLRPIVLKEIVDAKEQLLRASIKPNGNSE